MRLKLVQCRTIIVAIGLLANVKRLCAVKLGLTTKVQIARCAVKTGFMLGQYYNEFGNEFRSWADVGLMLGQRRRRWLNMKPSFAQLLVFACFLVEQSCCCIALQATSRSCPATSARTASPRWRQNCVSIIRSTRKPITSAFSQRMTLICSLSAFIDCGQSLWKLFTPNFYQLMRVRQTMTLCWHCGRLVALPPVSTRPQTHTCGAFYNRKLL